MSQSQIKDPRDSRTQHTDISLPDWWRLLPAAAHPYLLIARFDRPIGWWLLLLPGWWVIPLAAADPAAPWAAADAAAAAVAAATFVSAPADAVAVC